MHGSYQATSRRCVLYLYHLIQFLQPQSIQCGLLGVRSMNTAPYLLNFNCCHIEPPLLASENLFHTDATVSGNSLRITHLCEGSDSSLHQVVRVRRTL